MNDLTKYASPQRSSDLEIKAGYDLISEEKTLLNVLGSVSGITAVLDQNRQIVYANKELMDLLGISSVEELLGKRPGEAIGCIHAAEQPGGCGTSESCSVCGAVNAIIESQKWGIKTEKETRISSVISGNSVHWDLKVISSPVIIRNMTFYIFTIQDISNEKRWQNLERTFYHDILNSAANLNGLLTILKDGAEPEEVKELINISEEVSRELIEEIIIHRQIRAAENGDLVIKSEKLVASEILSSAVSRISGNDLAKTKRILFSDRSDGSEVMTDRLILHRILINLLKNAVEATANNGTVYAEVVEDHGKVRFNVKNDFIIPNDIKMQIFQRSFSTKGKGRGIGTYSIKLLGEKYLGGKVGFTSTDPGGTIFYIELPAA
jgi:nitrogen fixation/metabolism regulation signal transduction histidine kinase